MKIVMFLLFSLWLESLVFKSKFYGPYDILLLLSEKVNRCLTKFVVLCMSNVNNNIELFYCFNLYRHSFFMIIFR